MVLTAWTRPRFRLATLVAGLSILIAVSTSARAAELTEAERAYLTQNAPFTFCVDPDWAPYEIINSEGAHVGIAADLLRLAASRAGVALTLVPTKTWEESVAASKEGRCQILSFLNQSPARDAWLIFTDPLFVDRNVIVTREEHPYIENLSDVANESLVLPTGTSIEERVRRDFTKLKVVTANSEAETFAMVSQKKATMTMRSMLVAVHTIKEDGWFNLKISGQVPGYENKLRIGVAKDLVMLRDILNKGVREISAEEKDEIANRHVAIRVQSGVDYDLIFKIVALLGAVILTSFFWLIKLRALNTQLRALSQTDALTGLANRARLNERLQVEFERYRRYARPFAIILLDIDYFKLVNDEFGHLIGDKVLIAFADIARKVVRTQDVVGRWGGEEFLILCPETDLEQARVLAERIGHEVRGYDFALGHHLTASAGIAALVTGESPDGLLNRADEALYRAKRDGRDRVVVSASS
ncbi:diguanylate cyclase [Magnetospirillum fulvum]|uniref:diguanylate cyclase n=1 Tax=Magnetospirillum fulvum TaxID=1082 RepID=A0A1H6H3I9_MAGFU|nr:diguanylate cyclase [Magnetospirillum fulvum]SEH30006.1 periplasmic/7TM domain sensor diguanylate cyclase [Magnetospirillum fulvum]